MRRSGYYRTMDITKMVLCMLWLGAATLGYAHSVEMYAFPPSEQNLHYQVEVEAMLQVGKGAPLVTSSQNTLVQTVTMLQGEGMSRVQLESRDMVLKAQQGKAIQREFPAGYTVELVGDGQRYYVKGIDQGQVPGLMDTLRGFLKDQPAVRNIEVGTEWTEEGEINLPEIGQIPVQVTFRSEQVTSYRGVPCVVLAGRVLPVRDRAHLHQEVESLQLAGEAIVHYDLKNHRMLDTRGEVEIKGQMKAGNKFHGQFTSTMSLTDRVSQLPVTADDVFGGTITQNAWVFQWLMLAWIFVGLMYAVPRWTVGRILQTRIAYLAAWGLPIVIVSVVVALPLLDVPSAQADTAVSRGLWLGGALGYFLHTMSATFVLATSYTTFGLTSYAVSVFPGSLLYFGEPGYRFYLERAQRHFAMVIERGHYSSMTDEMVHSPSVLDILGHEADSVVETAMDFSYMGTLSAGNFIADRGEFFLFGALDLWEDLWSGNFSFPGAGYYRVGSATEYLDAERRTGRALAAPPVPVRGYPY